jgi:ATP-binding cassette subfamily B protein RaxB
MRQTETSECGLACLAIAAEKFGARIELSTLRQKYQMSTRGMTLREVKDIAADMGMVGRAVRCELEELADLKTPAILHWGFSHVVVLERVKGGTIRIQDPAVGRRDIGLNEASRQFTGVALELTPAADFVRRKEPSPLSLASWFRLIPEMVGPLTHILVLSLLLQTFVLASPFYIQLAIDQAALKGDTGILAILALGFGLLCIFNAAAALLRGIVTTKLTALLNWDMTVRLFRHLIRLPLPWYQRRRLADILSRFDAILPVRDLLSGALVAILVDGLLAIGTLVMMFIFAPVLAWVVLGGFALFVAIRLGALPLSIRLGMASITARIAENGKRIETVRAIQTIKVMGAESERESDWANKFARTISCDQNNALATLSFATIQGLVDGMVRIVLVYLGATAVMDGRMSVGLFYAFLTYQGQFTAKAGALFDQVINWRMTDMYSYRLADIVLSKKEEGIDAPAAGRPEIAGALEFKNLAFAYAPSEPMVFNNVSFRVNAGEFIAIVGPSGAGKSTLMKVLCGLYPASQGEVLLDGQPLSWWGPRAIRSALGVVMQDDELLAGTIAENVAFFDDQIDMERVWQSLGQAAFRDDVQKMPMRAETLIADMGSGLSGGQKQRLLLARAMYRNPRMLILDEATSHLDLQRESQINEALKALRITRIVVAHRQETIAAADRVIVLDKGRIVSDAVPGAMRMTPVA